MFPKVFFPALGSAAGAMASFATFVVAFVGRPVGAVVFGHYGDRIGRKMDPPRDAAYSLRPFNTLCDLFGLLPYGCGQ